MTKYELGRPGYNFIIIPDEKMELLFLYEDNFYRKPQIMKIARTLTGKSWDTITRWMNNVYYWTKLEEVGIYPYLATNLLNKHMITTRGDILNRKTLRPNVSNLIRNRTRVMEDNIIYEFYPGSMVYYKFMCPPEEAFDPEKDVPFFINKRGWNPDISNLRQHEVVKDAGPVPQYEEDKIDD